ncbi:PA2778 family cysteine peptidase [Caldimonas sp. KR1-144]|uniref:PA2778 family cysteine peptidase n=1 Tax=Caldimonas sp. KR1-144 TaxID=3400911 RepID=UPI003BFFF9FC
MRLRSRLAATLAVAAFVFGVAGCASLDAPQTAALKAAPPAGLPERVELKDTPFFPQEIQQCGPAALATVLSAGGVAGVSPERLGEEVFVPARGGSLQVEMLAAARRHDRFAVRLPARLDALLGEVAAGHPVVVLQNLSLPIAPRWHYAVVIGFDRPRGEMLLRSGTTERLAMSMAVFERTWARSGRWAFAALAPGELPRDVEPNELASAAVAYERSAAPRDAARVYAAVATRLPDDVTIAIGLGNARHAGGDLRGAADAFEAAARRFDSAPAWINLAHTRLALGERAAAREAAQRGLARAQQAEPQWLDAAREAVSATAQKDSQAAR